jgi:outer membrane protein TolC
MLQKLTEDDQQDLMDENFYIGLAVRYRPDLNMEKRALEIAWRKRQKAFADFFPELRLFSGFTLDTYDASYGGYKVSDARSRQGGFNYGIEGNWNLFRGFDTFNKVRQQEVLEKAAKWGLDAKFLEVVAEVRDAHSNCRNTRYQTEVFRSISRWVREQRDLVFSEYRNGRETITRLNEAQSALIEAQSRLVISAIQLKKSAIQLAAVTGTEYFK